MVLKRFKSPVLLWQTAWNCPVSSQIASDPHFENVPTSLQKYLILSSQILVKNTVSIQWFHCYFHCPLLGSCLEKVSNFLWKVSANTAGNCPHSCKNISSGSRLTNVVTFCYNQRSLAWLKAQNILFCFHKQNTSETHLDTSLKRPCYFCLSLKISSGFMLTYLNSGLLLTSHHPLCLLTCTSAHVIRLWYHT